MKKVTKGDVENLIGDSITIVDDDLTLQEKSNEFAPRVINKAKNSELNLDKQYK